MAKVIMLKPIFLRWLTAFAVAAPLAACAAQTVASPPAPIGVPVSYRQRNPGSSDDLLYIVANVRQVAIYTYPAAKLVTTFPTLSFPTSVCSDSNGNVFLVGYGGLHSSPKGYVYEFSHGGTEPIQTLRVGPYAPASCAVDPLTGKLAVANDYDDSAPTGNVAIFSREREKPVLYGDADFQWFSSVTYDDKGNLFVLGLGKSNSYPAPLRLAELPFGGTELVDVSLSEEIGHASEIHWDGSYLAILARRQSKREAPVIYRVQVTGSQGRVVGTTGFGTHKPSAGTNAYIDGSRIVLRTASHSFGYWSYPSGGKALKIKNGTPLEVHNMTVSAAAH